MDNPPGFSHARLKDAASQIRLLHFRGRSADGSLLFDMGHYQLSDPQMKREDDNSHIECATSYIAMSYTWGAPEKSHEVFIGGHRLRVGANCHYALRQAIEVEAYPALEQCYWMDQICINQQDIDEKEKQVSNMGEVYRRASAVFACVGPHADDSDVLLSTIKGLDMEAFEALPSDAPCTSRQELVHRLLEERGRPDKNFEKLRSVLEKFAVRPYWTRLWILQEIFLSITSVVLCGDGFVLLNDLASFWDAVKYYYFDTNSFFASRPPPETIQQLLSSKQGPQRDKMSFPDALKLSVGLGCVDRRDTMYGIRAMVSWPAHMDPPPPDYSISVPELFWKMVPYLDTENFSRGSHKPQPADMYMVRDVFNLNQDDTKTKARALASYRLLFRALHGVNMDGATVRQLLQGWVGSDMSHDDLPSAELIQAWQTALHPRPKNQKFREFSKEWEADPLAHIATEEKNYGWYGSPKEELAKQIVSQRLTGWRPDSTPESSNAAGQNFSAVFERLDKKH